jgi:hypothetical protein
MKMVGASFGDGKRESKHPIGYELRYNLRSATSQSQTNRARFGIT